MERLDTHPTTASFLHLPLDVLLHPYPHLINADIILWSRPPLPPLAIPLRLLIGATALSRRVEEEEEKEALPRNTLFARDLRLGGPSVGR